jgi:effector-binding domain-containing protein
MVDPTGSVSRMSNDPIIVDRPAQPYVAVRGLITMQTFHKIADRFPEVFGWLAAHGIEPTGAPFFKYNVIDMDRELELEAAVPVAEAVEGDSEVFGAVLPAGRYTTLTYRGHPEELVEVTGGLLAWAEEQGIEWDMAPSDRGDVWAARVEFLLTDPSVEPDMNKWETQLAFKLRD